MTRRPVALIAVLLAFGVAACGGEGTDLPDSPTGGLGGEPKNAGREDFDAVVPVEGARVVQHLAESAGKSFQLETQTRVEVTGSSTERALSRLCTGNIAVGLADRPATADELLACARNDIKLVRIPAGYHAVAIARNDELEIDCLTVDELRRLWSPGSAVNSYEELSGALPDRRVELHGAETRLADAELFSKAVTGMEGRLRSGYHAVDSFRAFLSAVGGDPGASGFFNYEEIRQGVGEDSRFVAVDEGDGCVTPTHATIQSGRYGALARPVYLYISRPALERYESVRSFALYLVQNYRQHILVTPTLVPATDAAIAAAERALPDATVPAG